MFARFFAADVVVGGHGGTVCACELLLAAVFSLCPPLVHDRSWTIVRRRRAASPLWLPLFARAAAFRSLSTTTAEVSG